MKKLLAALCVLLLSSPSWGAEFTSPLTPLLGDSTQRAFPTAEGYGAHATGGRSASGVVAFVTNTNDTGAGSLREAVNSGGTPTTVVFTVSGTLTAASNILVGSNVTIAGQTAPGDGFCIKGSPLRVRTIDSNVIVRHMCSRPGEGGTGVACSNRDAFQVDGQNVILDHVSGSWSTDELMQMWIGADDVTIQRSIFAEALNVSCHPSGAHSMGILTGPAVTNISILNNVMAYNHQRNPRISRTTPVDIIGNVIVGWGIIGTDIDTDADSEPASDVVDVNIVNNVYVNITGIPSQENKRMWIRTDGDDSAIYISGNEDEDGGSLTYSKLDSDPGVIVGTPGTALYEVDTSAGADMTAVLDNVGRMVPERDAVDLAIVAGVIAENGGLIDDPSESLAGGYPTLNSTAALLDTDSDGMPDAWEISHGLDHEDASDRNNDMVGDGWSNLETYLNQLAGDYADADFPFFRKRSRFRGGLGGLGGGF